MYKKFLIQQILYNGITYSSSGSVVDTNTAFHIVCKESPFKRLPETREPAKRTWHDVHGEDVLIPAGGLRIEAYDWEVKFLYSYGDFSAFQASGEATYDEWLAQHMHDDIEAFVDYILCRKDASGNNRNDQTTGIMLALFDEYTMTGVAGAYVKEISPDIYVYNDTSEKAVAEFSVTFRVVNPTSSLGKNLITE